MELELTHVTFQGPVISDHDLLALLPTELRLLLEQINGFIQFAGGLHIRGACHEPAWHSLRAAWNGDDACFRHYPAIRETDVPFGQDCLGDQFLLREGKALRLFAETGEVSETGFGINEFLAKAHAEPVTMLNMQPLLQFRNGGGKGEASRLPFFSVPFSSVSPFPPSGFTARSDFPKVSWTLGLSRIRGSGSVTPGGRTHKSDTDRPKIDAVFESNSTPRLRGSNRKAPLRTKSEIQS